MTSVNPLKSVKSYRHGSRCNHGFITKRGERLFQALEELWEPRVSCCQHHRRDVPQACAQDASAGAGDKEGDSNSPAAYLVAVGMGDAFDVHTPLRGFSRLVR